MADLTESIFTALFFLLAAILVYITKIKSTQREEYFKKIFEKIIKPATATPSSAGTPRNYGGIVTIIYLVAVVVIGYFGYIFLFAGEECGPQCLQDHLVSGDCKVDGNYWKCEGGFTVLLPGNIEFSRISIQPAPDGGTLSQGLTLEAGYYTVEWYQSNSTCWGHASVAPQYHATVKYKGIVSSACYSQNINMGIPWNQSAWREQGALYFGSSTLGSVLGSDPEVYVGNLAIVDTITPEDPAVPLRFPLKISSELPRTSIEYIKWR